MQFVLTFLIGLALTLGQLAVPPAQARPPIAHATLARTLAQPPAPLAAHLQIVDPGSSPPIVFSVVYTLTVTWPSSTVVTTTTTIPPYLTVTSAPGCTHIGNRIGCMVDAQAGQPHNIVFRFGVPWDIRGQVDITSTATDGSGGSAAAGASFNVPPQYRLPFLMR